MAARKVSQRRANTFRPVPRFVNNGHCDVGSLPRGAGRPAFGAVKLHQDHKVQGAAECSRQRNGGISMETPPSLCALSQCRAKVIQRRPRLRATLRTGICLRSSSEHLNNIAGISTRIQQIISAASTVWKKEGSSAAVEAIPAIRLSFLCVCAFTHISLSNHKS